MLQQHAARGRGKFRLSDAHGSLHGSSQHAAHNDTETYMEIKRNDTNMFVDLKMSDGGRREEGVRWRDHT